LVLFLAYPERRKVNGAANKQAYERYIELLNAQDFGALDEVVDPERYREICVGFTPGWVNLPEAVASLEKVVVGIPDLHARIEDLASENDRVYARLTVTGTNTGCFFGAPPTRRHYEVPMFDYARLEDGRIVERIQQSDTLSQLIQMYSGAARKGAIAAALLGAATVFALRRRRKRTPEK
jgi:predicted ester cyclase